MNQKTETDIRLFLSVLLVLSDEKCPCIEYCSCTRGDTVCDLDEGNREKLGEGAYPDRPHHNAAIQSPNVRTRNTAIWARVTGSVGQ